MQNSGRDIPGVTRDFRDDELRQIEAKWKSSIEKKVDSMDGRLRVMERLMFIGLGGLLVIAGLVSFLGGTILKVLQHA